MNRIKNNQGLARKNSFRSFGGFTLWNARNKRAGKANSKGFTIMELMIATTVFSIILLLALAGFLQIGQLFYKGVNITRTSDVGQQAISSIKADLSFDNGSSTAAINYSPLTTPSYNRGYFCAGANRYAFVLGRMVDSDEATAEINGGSASNQGAGWYKFGLIKERFNGPGCQNPFDEGAGVPIIKNNATILLGDKMRLSNLSIVQIGSTSLYTLDVRIAYGIDEVLTSPPNAVDAKCQSGANYSRYCFVTEVRTTVRKGLSK